jgi:murein DD-endopeptidase MepM/ murein hydrolase activator NlpD
MWLLVLLVLLLSLPAQAQRVALLIGNANYQSAPLRNPPNDVREMESALRAVGFKVQTVLNANQNQMKRAVRDFGTAAQGAEVALLYYSGHGTQAGGENYLIPIGVTIEKEADYEVEAVSANALMRQIAGARPKAAIVVLDACRDNPYAAVTKSTAKGLGRMDAPSGTMIAFATAPNSTASDEGHYARVLAAQIRTPGLELLDVFRNTTAEVRRLSSGKQEPRMSEVAITDRIYFIAPAPPGNSIDSAVMPPPAPQAPAAVAAPAMAGLEASPTANPDDVGFSWPATGTLLYGYSEAKRGLGITGPEGSPVLAAADARVVYVGAGLRGYGNLVILKHNNTYLSAYAHNRSILVSIDQTVKKGQQIAEMGNSDADRMMLHFEIRKQGKPVDPEQYLPRK